MTKHLHHKLLKKGWTLEEIKKLSEISEKAKLKKPKFIKVLDSSVYWLFLVVAILGNLAVSIILVPFMFFFTGIPLYSIVAILGIVLGLFLDHLIHDMEHLVAKHHIMAGLFIIALGIVTIVYMTFFAKNLIRVAGLSTQQDPVIIGTVYTIALIIPYLSTKIMRIRR
jgi:hypothetical protein